jgi:hypothetical protein
MLLLHAGAPSLAAQLANKPTPKRSDSCGRAAAMVASQDPQGVASGFKVPFADQMAVSHGPAVLLKPVGDPPGAGGRSSCSRARCPHSHSAME